MNTRDLFVSKLKEHGLWDWFLSKFANSDGRWEHKHSHDTGWRFRDSPPAIWYQQDVLFDPHEYGTTDREFASSSDPDDQRMVEFMLKIGFVERTIRKEETILPEVWPQFLRIEDNQ